MKSTSLKYFVFCFLVLLVILLFFWRLSLFFIYPNLIYLGQLGIIYLIFLALISLFFFLIDNRYFVYLILFLLAFSFLIFFPFDEIYFLAGFLVLLLLSVGYEYARREKKQRIKISLKKSCFKGLSFVVLAISLLLAVIYYFNPLLTINQQALEIPPQVFKPLVNLSNEILSNSLSAGLSQTGLINLENQGIEVEIAKMVNQELKEFIGPYSQEISIGIAVALFLVLRFVGMILGMVSIIMARIIFYILFVCKVVKIDFKMKPVEVIKF
ncbi:hypothetical protein B6D52_01290 [Candidatus Parcubacteria bacterium 4484_255]|nr:MAG: hypothetical protein B6D52_01290 [Candidatus Parcubacteria bacterium 4484_255]